MKKKNILITGGAGFLGSKLATKLVYLGYNVFVVDLQFYSNDSLDHLTSFDNFHFSKSDIRNEKIVKKIVKNMDYIIPLAALVGAPLCDKKKKIAVDTNVNAIKKIIKFSKKKQKLIYLTSNSGYGIGQKDKFCDENSPLNPVSLYGRTKNESEKLVMKRKNCVCFRLATVFGYSFRMRTDLLVNNFVYTAMSTNALKIFEGSFRRNFIHIDDVVDGIIFSIQNFNKLKNNVYNMGLSSANITKLELAKKIKKFIPKVKITKILNQQDPDKRDYFVSNDKIERKGFAARKSLESGIIELIKIFKKNLKKYKNNY